MLELPRLSRCPLLLVRYFVTVAALPQRHSQHSVAKMTRLYRSPCNGCGRERITLVREQRALVLHANRAEACTARSPAHG